MAKFFSRVSKDKQDCTITLTIKTLEIHVNVDQTLQVIFERGPQKDLSNKFQVTPN